MASLRALKSEGLDFNLARKPLTMSEIRDIVASRLGNGNTGTFSLTGVSS